MPEIPIIITGEDRGGERIVQMMETRLIGFGRAATQTTNTARDSMGRFVKTTTDAGKAIDNIGSNNGLKNAAGKAHTLFEALHKARKETEGVRETMEGVRNAGAVLAGIGAGGLYLASSLAKAAEEGERADAKLSAMLDKRGEGDAMEQMASWAGDLAKQAAMVDDDPIKEAAAGLLGFGLNAAQIREIMPGLIGQSRLYGQSLDGVAAAFGKAFASGNAGALKKSGVTISEADTNRIKDMTNEGDRQRAMFEVVKQSMDKYALSITEGMAEGEIASNRFALAMDNAQTNIGAGSSVVIAKVLGIGAAIVEASNQAPELQGIAGAIGTVGAGFTTAAGTVIGFAGQVGMASLGLKAMGISGVTALGAIKAAAIATLPWLALIGATALISAAALYGLDKILHAREDAELQKNIAAGDATDPQRLENSNKMRAKRGQAPETMEQFKAREAGDDDAGALPPGMADVQKQLSGIQAQMATANAAPMPSLSFDGPSQLTGDDDEDISTGSKSGDKAAKKAAKDAERAGTKAQREADKVKKKAETTAEKERKAAAKAKEKDDKEWAKFRTEQFDRAADLRIATIEESYATRIAGLEALKTDGNSAKIEYQIAQFEAEKIKAIANVYKDGEGELEYEQKKRLAAVRSRGLLDRAGIAFSKAKQEGGIGKALAEKGIGGSYDLRASANGSPFNMSSGAYGNAQPFAQFADTKPRRYEVDTRNAPTNANGDQIITVIVKRNDDGFMAASGAF